MPKRIEEKLDENVLTLTELRANHRKVNTNFNQLKSNERIDMIVKDLQHIRGIAYERGCDASYYIKYYFEILYDKRKEIKK